MAVGSQLTAPAEGRPKARPRRSINRPKRPTLRAPLPRVELVDRLPRAGLPLARVGLHSGPVVFQNGDYFGRTVDIAARITDYARPGEVLVSDPAVDAT
jgi:adenylate cyclase